MPESQILAFWPIDQSTTPNRKVFRHSSRHSCRPAGSAFQSLGGATGRVFGPPGARGDCKVFRHPGRSVRNTAILLVPGTTGGAPPAAEMIWLPVMVSTTLPAPRNVKPSRSQLSGLSASTEPRSQIEGGERVRHDRLAIPAVGMRVQVVEIARRGVGVAQRGARHVHDVADIDAGVAGEVHRDARTGHETTGRAGIPRGPAGRERLVQPAPCRRILQFAVGAGRNSRKTLEFQYWHGGCCTWTPAVQGRRSPALGRSPG